MPPSGSRESEGNWVKPQRFSPGSETATATGAPNLTVRLRPALCSETYVLFTGCAATRFMRLPPSINDTVVKRKQAATPDLLDLILFGLSLLRPFQYLPMRVTDSPHREPVRHGAVRSSKPPRPPGTPSPHAE